MNGSDLPDSSSSRKGTRKRRCCGCCAGLLGAPVLLALALWAAILYRGHWDPVPVPAHGMPNPNARDDFIRAGEMLRRDRHLFPISMPPVPEETYAMYTSAAKDAAPALAELRKGFGKEYRNPPRRTIAEFTAVEPYSSFRELARTLSGMARYHEVSGRPVQAADCLLDGMEMGAMIAHDGALLAYLVSRAIEAISMRPFERLLQKLSASELAQVAARLERIEAKRVPVAVVLREAGYVSAAEWQGILRQFDTYGLRHRWALLRLYVRPAPVYSVGWFSSAALLALGDRPSLIGDEIRYFHEYAAAAERPYQGRPAIRPSALEEITGSVVTLDGTLRMDVKRRACAGLLRTEVALYRFRSDSGRFPDTLAELTPRYLARVPDDPCGGAAGRPLKYRVVDGGKGFLLYSLGVDLHDDGGAPIDRGSQSDSPGDIVAGRMWPSSHPRPVKGAPVQ